MKIAVLGMGRMGAAMAARLAESDHHVEVWNRTPGRAGPALEAGAQEAESVRAAVSGAEVTVSMLAADDAVKEVALGPDGIHRHLPSGAAYVDSSTVSPATTAELAGRFERFVAMPVLGSPDAVRSGAAGYLAGGPAHVLDFIEPLTLALTGNLTRFDAAPLALAAKVTANYLLLSGLAVLAEAFEVARAGGLTDDRIAEVFGASPLVAPGLRNRFEAVLKGSEEGWFPIRLGAKDVGLAVAQAGRGLKVAEAVKSLFDGAAAGDLASADVAAVGRVYRS